MNKFCPFQTIQMIAHNDKKNYMVPKYGMNKRIDYDVVNTSFKPCIEKDCMAWDSIMHTCKRCE